MRGERPYPTFFSSVLTKIFIHDLTSAANHQNDLEEALLQSSSRFCLGSEMSEIAIHSSMPIEDNYNTTFVTFYLHSLIFTLPTHNFDHFLSRTSKNYENLIFGKYKSR